MTEIDDLIERSETAPWRPRRGPLTRWVAWAIVLVVAGCVLLMVADVLGRLIA